MEPLQDADRMAGLESHCRILVAGEYKQVRLQCQCFFLFLSVYTGQKTCLQGPIYYASLALPSWPAPSLRR